MEDQKFKADAGKAKPDLIELGFPRALRLVQATLEYGSIKYEEHSWRDVPNGMARYNRAGRRHRQARDMVADPTQDFFAVLEACDEESGLPHIAHEIFNLLCMIELEFQEHLDREGLMRTLLGNMKEPPLDHKA